MLRLGEGLAWDEISIIVLIDEAGIEHFAEGLLGLGPSLLLALQLSVLLQELVEGLELVLHGLPLGFSLKLLVLDLLTSSSAFRPDFHPAANERKVRMSFPRWILEKDTYRWPPVPRV